MNAEEEEEEVLSLDSGDIPLIVVLLSLSHPATAEEYILILSIRQITHKIASATNPLCTV